jgi:hypothetical protein
VCADYLARSATDGGFDPYYRNVQWPVASPAQAISVAANAPEREKRAYREKSRRRLAEEAERDSRDRAWRMTLPGEQAVAAQIDRLFEDAGWYMARESQFPDGLTPYAHTPEYLQAFNLATEAIAQVRQRRLKAQLPPQD